MEVPLGYLSGILDFALFSTERMYQESIVKVPLIDVLDSFAEIFLAMQVCYRCSAGLS